MIADLTCDGLQASNFASLTRRCRMRRSRLESRRLNSSGEVLVLSSCSSLASTKGGL